MKVILPVAGLGTRLRPHTLFTPKPLLKLAGKPIIGHVIDSFKNYDIDEIILVISEEGKSIFKYVKGAYPFKVSYVVQKEVLGLGNAILLTYEMIKDSPVLIVLGDTIFRGNLSPYFQDNFIVIHPVQDPRRFGVVTLENDRIIYLEEKPEHPESNLAIVGIYYFKNGEELFRSLKELEIKKIQTRGEFQLTDAIAKLLKEDIVIKKAEIAKWLDCGKIETLIETHRELLKEHSIEHSYKGSIVIPPCYIEKEVTMKESIVGPYVSIGKGAKLLRSLIQDTIIGEEAEISHVNIASSIIGKRAKVQEEGFRLNLGDYSSINF